MAYIRKDTVTEKRNEIKKNFPSKDGWKFSVTGGNTSSLQVALMQYPKEYDFGEGNYSINHYSLENSCKRKHLSEKAVSVLAKVIEIMTDGHWDKSDSMTDYFHCAWYNNIEVGKWNKSVVGV